MSGNILAWSQGLLSITADTTVDDTAFAPSEVWTLPTLPASSFLLVTQEAITQSGRQGIRVVNAALLPGTSNTVWNLEYTGYQGTAPSPLIWTSVPLTSNILNHLIAEPIPSATYRFRLVGKEPGKDPIYLTEATTTTGNDNNYQNIQTLLGSLSDITADGKLTTNEKVIMSSWWTNAVNENSDLNTKASAVSVSAVAYNGACNALSALAATTWQSAGTTDISALSPTLYTLWSNYWTERTKLQNAITDKANTGVTQLNSVDYLTNADKIKLMQDWTAEQSTQAQLVAQANSLSVSHSSYDAAVTVIDTYLGTTLGYSTWKTTFPDGVTSGPNTGVLNTLRTYWNTVASQRATLQLNISNQQAITQGNTAISTAAMDAANKSNAVAITVPKTVTGLPTLPDTVNYPSGRLIYETGTKKLYRSTGSTWEAAAATVTPSDLSGQLTTSQVTGIWPTGQIPVIDFSAGIGGATKPANNATVGAPSGTPVGSTTADNAALGSTQYLGQIQSITLSGSQTSFYPVLLMSNCVLTGAGALNYEFTVYRPDVHENSSNLGSYSADCIVRAFAWGHAAPKIKKVDQNTGFGTYTWGLADIYPTTANSGIILMLRGGMTHHFSISSPLGAVTITPYMSGYTDAIPTNIPVQTSAGLQPYLNQSYRPDSKLHGNQSITARTITADRIAANAITANEIAADTITAGQIAASAIGTNELAAGSVVASKMSMVGASLVADACFESGSAGWTGHTGLIIAGSSLSGCPGKFAGQFNNRDCPSNTSIPVAAGEKYYCSLSCYAYGGSGGGGGIGIVVYGYDRSGNIVDGYCLTNTTNTSSWVTLSGTITVGPNTVSLAVGPWIDLPYGWVSANGGPLFTNMVLRKMNDASLIVDGAITTNKLNANSIQTSNYAESGGNPTAGCKMDIQGTALKVAPNNLQVGQYVATDAFFRAFNALDGSNASGKTFYKGNIDNSSTYRYGAPDIAKFYIQSAWQQTAAGRFMLNFFLRPTATTDNLDAMRYAKIDFYRGNASAATYIMTGYVNLPDRLYANATDSNIANASGVSQYFETDTVSGILSGNDPRWYLLITIYNAYGPSDTKWFIPPSALNTDWTQQTSAPFTGGSSGGTGGGSGGSGTCPAPYTLLDTLEGQVEARNIQVGMKVHTLNENTCEYGDYEVEAVETGINDIYTLELEDGRLLDFAGNHRFLTDVAWMELQVMTPGINILGSNPGIVKQVTLKQQDAEVIKITVKDAHTYQTSGLLSHNLKSWNG